jgi:hypothetical protein
VNHRGLSTATRRMSAPARSARTRKKPVKPCASFPPTPHRHGPWCRKTRGKVHFSGIRKNRDAVSQRRLRVAKDLRGRRQPCSTTIPVEGPHVKDVCKRYRAVRPCFTAPVALPCVPAGITQTDSQDLLSVRGGRRRPPGWARFCVRSAGGPGRLPVDYLADDTGAARRRARR